MDNTISKIPIVFEENINPNLENVKYVMRNCDYNAHFSENEVILYLNQYSIDEILENNKEQLQQNKNLFWKIYNKLFNKDNTSLIESEIKPNNILKLKFNNCNKETRFLVEEELPYYINYIKGNNKENWIQNKPAYVKIKQQNLYKGIDIVYYEQENKLSYDFMISKNANPKDINFSIEGSSNIEIDENGDINISKDISIVIIKKPKTYQIINEKIVDIDSRYILDANNIKFEIEEYDKSIDLIIDPTVEHVNIIGGSKEDSLEDSVLDKEGNIYLIGKTLSVDYPLIGEQSQTISYDTFLLKLDKDGNTVYSIRVGGSDDDEGKSIAVDSEGCVYITGRSKSNDFPLKNEIQNYSGGWDVFLAKIKIQEDKTTKKENGNLLFSTYLGGRYDDCANSICVDNSNNVYITGYTNSSDFPKSHVDDTEINKDIFITKLQIDDNISSNSKVLNTKLLNGEQGEGNFISIDNNDNIYVVGEAKTDKFPVEKEIYNFKGEKDIYAIKLYPSMNIKFATYLNQGIYNSANALVVDYDQNIYITGYTAKYDYSNKDVCIYRINKWGEINLNKKLEGNKDEEGLAINVDKYDNIYVGGYTSSSNFPILNSCIRYNIGQYGFLTKLNSYGDIVFSTYSGKSDCKTAINSINLDKDRNIYISGNTSVEAMSFTRGLSSDNQNIFIVKINQEPEVIKKVVEFADINLIAKLEKNILTEKEVSELYSHPNEINPVYFYISEETEKVEKNIDIDNCGKVSGLIEMKNIIVTLGIEYKIGLVLGKNDMSNLNIFDLVEGFAQNKIDYGCVYKNKQNPTIDDFKIKIEVNDMPISEFDDYYIFNIIGKIYIEY